MVQLTTPRVITRPCYGIQGFVEHDHGLDGRLQLTLLFPVALSAEFNAGPYVGEFEIHNVWYLGTGNPAYNEVLFSPSYFAYWGWVPIGTTVNMTIDPTADDHAALPVASNFCGDLVLFGPGYDSRDASPVDNTESRTRAIPVGAASVWGIQSHQFKTLSIGLRNPGGAALTFTIADAESLREIASGNVAAGASDTIVLTDELPDAIKLSLGAANATAGILTVKGTH